MNQRQIDEAQQAWITDIARVHPPALHVGCGMKPIAGAVNLDPNPDRWAWVNVAADAHRLPFRDRSFGSVVSSHVLEHLHSPKAALRDMARVLRQDGVMGHVVPDHRFTPHRQSHRHPFAHHHYEWDGPADLMPVLDGLEDVLAVVELQEFPGFNWSFCMRAVKL